jgi:predicted small secreted protein
MKTLVAITLTLALTACHTASGFVQGAGKDLTAAGKWIEPSNK